MCRSCTRPARSGPKCSALRIGGRTSARKPSSSMSATSARIRPTTICDERTRIRSLPDVTPGSPVLPRTPPLGRHIPRLFKNRCVMTDIPMQVTASKAAQAHSPGVVLRSIVIGLTAFLTVVDLFATQAILPSLARHYQVAPAAMGFAVNATTLGMALAGLVVGFFSPLIDRRRGILLSLILLAVPT